MTINLLRVTNLILSICCLLLTIAILRYSIKRLSMFALGVLFISVSSFLWMLILTLLLIFADNLSLGNIFARLSWVGSFIIASYTFSSLSQVLNNERSLMAKIIMAMQFIIAGLFAVLAFTNLGIKEVLSIYPLQRVEGKFGPIFRIWIIVSIIYSLYLSLKYYFEIQGFEKLKYKYYIFSMIIYAVSGMIFVGILPLVFHYENLIYFTPICCVVWLLGLFYAVRYYKILNIEVFFCDLIKYIIFIALVGILNYFLFFIFVSFDLSPFLSSTLSIILIGTIYFISSIKEDIEKITKFIFLHSRKDYKEIFKIFTKAFAEILDLDELLNFIIEELKNLFGVSKIAIFLLEEKKSKNDKDEDYEEDFYKLEASYGLSNLKDIRFKNRRLTQWLKEHKEPFLIDISDGSFDKGIKKELFEDLKLLGAVIIIPIIHGEELLGMITLSQKKASGMLFDAEEIEFLKILSIQLGIAIKNSIICRELNNAYMQITRTLSLTLESKDKYLIGHTDKVTKYAIMLGKEIGLSNKEMYILTQAAMLHDLGKVGIHDYILSKPGNLTQKEWEEVKQHPLNGAKILKTLPFLEEVSEVVLYHHEHYDGSGYPLGLKGEEIPLLARILTLADAVDAMLSERPYKDLVMSIKEVIEELKQQKGKHFDPYLVDRFLEIIQKYPDVFETRIENIEDYNYEK